jgi:hypothetical protein
MPNHAAATAINAPRAHLVECLPNAFITRSSSLIDATRWSKTSLP